MFAHNVALRIDIEHGVIEAATARFDVALAHADSDVGISLFGGAAQSVRGITGNGDRVAQKLGVHFVERLFVAGRDGPYPVRVRGDEGFGESYQARSLSTSRDDEFTGLVDGCVTIEKYGSCLHGGYFEGGDIVFWHCYALFWCYYQMVWFFCSIS